MSFQFDFTIDKFKQIIVNPNSDAWFVAITDNLPSYQIDTKLRVAAWLAQVGHESGSFKWLTENLNYTADQLMRVFPYYFSDANLANQYAHHPEMIANKVYGNRLGNGPESSGEGWKFRGRGIIQITGKENYTKCSQAMYGDENILLDSPELLADMDGAVRSACWFWNLRSLNMYADNGDMETITRRINGGTNGYQDRLNRYNLAMSIL